MKFTTVFVPALLAASVTTIIAQNAATPPTAVPPPPRTGGFQPSGAFNRTPGANPAPGANIQRVPGQLPGGGMGNQTPIDRVMTNDAAIAKTGIDKAKFDEIRKAYKEYNDKVEELQKTLNEKQEAQAKLVADKASEEEVGAAVEAFYKVRTEIAKLQTFKALKSAKLFTNEELDKIREVDMENMRARMTANRPAAPDGTTPGGNRPGMNTRQPPADGAAPPNRPGGFNRPGAPADGTAPGTNPGGRNNTRQGGGGRAGGTTPAGN